MFTDTYLPSRDGVVNSILIAREQLEEMGHEVTVFAPDPGEDSEKEEGTYYFRSLEYKKYKGYRIPLFPTNKCEILRDLGVDVIHSHGLLFMALRSMFAGRTLKKPVVVSFHTMITDALSHYADLPLPVWMMDKLFWIYLRNLLERAEVVIAPSNAIKHELMEYAPDMKRIEVVPTGVDCDRFSLEVDGSAVRTRHGLNGRKVILHVGRIAWEKNLDLIFNTFSDMRKERGDLKLMIVGDGPAKEYYMEKAEELGVEEDTIFTGFVSDQELPQYYAAGDVFVLASKFETQGLVLLEAMASGKPVACIDYRATGEIVNDGVDGFLFTENEESCARAISRGLNSPPEIGQRAREKAKRYSHQGGAERLVDLYEFAIEQKKQSSRGRIFGGG